MDARLQLLDSTPAQRAARWRQALAELFQGVRVWTPARGLEGGSAEVGALGPCRLASVEGSAQRLERTRGGSSFLLVLRQEEGRGCLHHGSSSVELSPGDVVIVDSERPVVLELADGFRQTMLELPREDALRRHAGLLARVGVAQRGAGAAVLGAALSTSARGLPAMRGSERGCVAEGLLGLVGLLAGPVAPECDRFEQARTLIEVRLQDAAFTAEEVARAQGISRRHLDALFAARGLTVAGYLRERRLVRLSEALRDPRHAQRSVLDLALSHGFVSAAHVARAFAARFGQPPSRWRSGR